MQVYGFLLLWSLFEWGLDAKPGIKVRITHKGLNYGKEFGTEFLEKRLKETILEDLNGLQSFGLGRLSYTLSKIRIDSIDFPVTSASLIPGTGISLLFQDATATVSTDWAVKSWLINKSGKATVIISGVFITAVAAVSLDETHHPSVSLENCQANIRDLDIELDEQSSWLYRRFVDFLKKPIRVSVEEGLCPYVNDTIQEINAEFRQYPFRTQIDSFIQVDNTLENPPAFFKTFINVDLKGTAYPAENDTEPPFEAARFVLPDKNDSMLYIGLSEYFFQSASVAYYTSGAFNISTTKKLSSYLRLTTNAFGNVIPMIAKQYAEPQPIMVNLTATTAPTITLHRGRFLLEFAGSIEVLAAPRNSTAQSLFTLNTTINTHASLTIFDQKLLSALCVDSFQLSLAHSNVGFFKVSLLESFISYVIHNGVIPAANAKLKNGFSVPYLDSLILLDSAVEVHQGYLLISTDVNYKL